MIFGSVSRDNIHFRNMTACWTVASKSSWRPTRILTCCQTCLFIYFMLSLWYAKHCPVAFALECQSSPIQFRRALLKKWCLLAPFGVPIRCPKNCTPNGATWHLQIWRGTLLLLAPFGHPSGWCQVAPLLSICGTHIMALLVYLILIANRRFKN